MNHNPDRVQRLDAKATRWWTGLAHRRNAQLAEAIVAKTLTSASPDNGPVRR